MGLESSPLASRGVRTRRRHRATDATQRLRHECGGADAVDVVVTMHEDHLARSHRLRQPLGGPGEIDQGVGWLEMLERGAQEAFGLLHRPNAARREEPADRERHGRLSHAVAAGRERGGELLGDVSGRGGNALPPRGGTRVAHTAWYIRTPHTSQSSIVVPDIIACRRCIGIAVSQAPQASAFSGTSTCTRFLFLMRS